MHYSAVEPPPAAVPRPWIVLGVLSIAQLTVLLDGTLVNIALPHAQDDLGISAADRQWVVTAYNLACGGLLLLGGRIADYWGRRKALLAGIAGFAAASVIAGTATTGWVLIAGRAAQGACAALVAPACLALMSVSFSEGRNRARAFAVFGVVQGSAAVAGLLIGGALTEYGTWRLALLVNVPLAALSFAGAAVWLRESTGPGRPRYDVLGAVLATGGLLLLTFGCARLVLSAGTGAAPAAGAVVGGGILLAAFALAERRAPAPLLPLGIVADAHRGGAMIAASLAAGGIFGSFLFMTFYFQSVRGYPALATGEAFLPVAAAVVVAAWASTRIGHRTSPRTPIAAGCVIAAAGLLVLTGAGPRSSFAVHVLPAEILIGLGLGLAFVPLASVALRGVAPGDAGVAGAVFNAIQQAGVAVWTAVLNGACAAATGAVLARRPLDTAGALVAGYRTAYRWGAACALAGALVALVLLRDRPDRLGAVQHESPRAAPAITA